MTNAHDARWNIQPIRRNRFIRTQWFDNNPTSLNQRIGFSIASDKTFDEIAPVRLRPQIPARESSPECGESSPECGENSTECGENSTECGENSTECGESYSNRRENTSARWRNSRECGEKPTERWEKSATRRNKATAVGEKAIVTGRSRPIAR
jgi:hypothetical protein